MKERIFMQVDETTAKVMESIQQELSKVMDAKISEQGQKIRNITIELESIGEDIAGNKKNFENLNKAIKELKESEIADSKQLQMIQQELKRVSSLTEKVNEKSNNFQTMIKSSCLESTTVIENVLNQQKTAIKDGISSQIELLSSLSCTVSHTKDAIIEKMNSQEKITNCLVNDNVINKSYYDRMLKILDSNKLDYDKTGEAIQSVLEKINDIAICIDEFKNEIEYFKIPFYKRWFSKRIRGNNNAINTSERDS